MKAGKVYLAGAGPGDTGLVTVRTRELIQTADLIIYDYLCNPALLAWARADAEKIYAGKSAVIIRSRRSRLMRCWSSKRARVARCCG